MKHVGLLTVLPCACLLGLAPALSGQVSHTAPMTPEQRDILSHLSVVQLPDGLGGFVYTIRLSGANFQTVNGTGSTDTINGLGNLIVGYNELGNPHGDNRTGSHNIVGGRKNTFSDRKS